MESDKATLVVCSESVLAPSLFYLPKKARDNFEPNMISMIGRRASGVEDSNLRSLETSGRTKGIATSTLKEDITRKVGWGRTTTFCFASCRRISGVRHKITHPMDNIWAFRIRVPGVVFCGRCASLCIPGDEAQGAGGMKDVW